MNNHQSLIIAQKINGPFEYNTLLERIFALTNSNALFFPIYFKQNCQIPTTSKKVLQAKILLFYDKNCPVDDKEMRNSMAFPH